MHSFSVQRVVCDYDMEAAVIVMPQDIHIVLTGGCCPHIGAISVFDHGQQLESIQFEGHKEGTLSRRWAEQLSLQYEKKCTVACGIHYDQASKQLIDVVVKESEQLLNEVIQNLNRF